VGVLSEVERLMDKVFRRFDEIFMEFEEEFNRMEEEILKEISRQFREALEKGEKPNIKMYVWAAKL
jgi:vacuolar-type H+-ATPase subunit E/Vma4